MTRARGLRATCAAMSAAGLLMVGAGVAHADGTDPVGGLVAQVTKKVAGPTKQSTAHRTQPSKDAPDPPASDDDSPGHETQNPKAPDHGSSRVGHVALGGQDLASVGSGRSTVNDDDSTDADSTLLAVGGQKIIGSHATSDGGPGSSHAGAPQVPVCEQSGGQICLDLLYADSAADENGASSDSRTSSGLANLCLGGDDATGQTCDNGVTADVAGSTSRAHRNQTSGRTTADSASGLANVCVQRDPVTGSCTVAADAISSDGHADSDGSASRSSQVLNLTVAGNGAGLPDDPFAVSVPAHCVSPSIVCAFGNQGETYAGDNVIGTSQTALDVAALDQNLLATIAQSETLVHNDGGAPVVSPPSNPSNPTSPAHPRPAARVDNGILPNTGGVWSGLLGIGLALFGAGAVAAAWERRRVAV